MEISGIMVGTAGVYQVMSELAIRGFHAAATHGNAPNFDILVCTPKGEDILAIQVKSSLWATRDRGRGENRTASLMDFPFSYHAAKICSEKVLFAFVDFGVAQNFRKPDIYFIPATETSSRCAGWIEDYCGKMVRFTQPIDWMSKFKNIWTPLDRYKDIAASQAIHQTSSAPVEGISQAPGN